MAPRLSYTSGATVANYGMGDLVWANEAHVSVLGTILQRDTSECCWTAGASFDAFDRLRLRRVLVASETNGWRCSA
jgi:hypothetical protein